MEDIIISLQPAFHRVERFILWKNRYASLLAFALGHCLFYAMARAGLRPFCAITLVVLIFHVLDSLKQKRSHLPDNDDRNLCELTQLVLRSYRHVCQTHEKFNTLKTENRVKYSVILIVICLTLAFIGVKINGFYVSYLSMLILFTLPAVVYHKLLPKALQRLAPVLEQLDQSMEYKRRSLIDRKDLLVNINKPGYNNNDDDDEDVRRLKQQQVLLKQETSPVKPRPQLHLTDDDEEDDEANEQRLIDTNDQSQTILNFRQRYQNEANTNVVAAAAAAVVPKHTSMGDSSFDMLSDSSSSAVEDDETARISELYANVADHIDGKHRIRVKNDELKIKGRSNKQRPKLMDAQFFQSTDKKPSASTMLINSSSSNHPQTNEPDLTSFDFLNDYEEKA